MSIDKKSATSTTSQVSDKKRRGFLKKAVYAAPSIVALGALMKPTESNAGFGKPPSGPTWP